MPKSRAPRSVPAATAAVALAEGEAAAATKASINLRIDGNTRQLIDDAAAIVGKTRTEFIVDTARRQAIDVLLDQRLLLLSADHYDAFIRALDEPAPPGDKLRSLLRRVPAWRS